MKKQTTETILKGLRLNKKYDAIGAFLDSTFKVTNEGIPSMAQANPVMSNLVLQELKVVDAIISKDKEAIKIADIDVMDITTNRLSEISYFVWDSILMSNAYGYKALTEDLRAYHKAMRLEKAFPIEKRKARLEELENEITATVEIIESLKEVDEVIARSYGSKLSELNREYEAIKETLYYKDMHQIKAETYSKVMARMNNIQDRVQAKIAFLEKILGGKYE